MNVDAIEREVVEPMVKRLAPYMAGEKEPKLKNYYILIFPGGGTIGVRPLDPSKIGELGRIVNEEITAGFPDLDVFAQQGNLFGGFGDGRNIELRLQSADFDALLQSARAAQDVITEKMPGAQVRSFQDLELAEPELRLIPDDRRISESGWTRANVATVVRALGDGIWVGEHFDGERRLDMILRAKGWDSPDALAAVPVATPTGGVVPLGELVRIEPTVSTTGLRRVDGRRTIGINVVAPPGTSLQQAMQKLETDVGPAIQPLLPPDGGIRYAGDAGSLETALADMRVNISLALLVLFLIMGALFRSAKDSAYVLLTVPLASLGGVLGIRFLNLFTPQTLDMLTMVGFIILLGAAVNNAILLVESTRVGRARRHGPQERRAPCARGAHAADLRDLARPARGTAADDHRAGPGRRAVPRPRHRHLRRHAVQYRIHARAPAGAPAPRRARGGEIRGEGGGARARGRCPMNHTMKTRSIAWCVAAAALAASSLAASAARAQDQAPPPAPVTVAPVTKGSVDTTVSTTGTVVSRNDARLAAEVTGRLDWVAEPGTKAAKGAPLARVDARALELQLKENDAQISRLSANADLLGTQLARLERAAGRHRVEEPDRRGGRAARDGAPRARAGARDTREHAAPHLARDDPRAISGLRGGADPPARRVRVRGHRSAAPDGHRERRSRRARAGRGGGPPRRGPGRHGARPDAGTAQQDPRDRAGRRRALAHDRGAHRHERRRLADRLGGPRGPAGGAADCAGLMVPRDAVIVRADGAHVFRVGKGDVAERIAVRVGTGDSEQVEITGSLAAGDRVVVRGGERLRPGQPVKIAAAPATKSASTRSAPRLAALGGASSLSYGSRARPAGDPRSLSRNFIRSLGDPSGLARVTGSRFGAQRAVAGPRSERMSDLLSERGVPPAKCAGRSDSVSRRRRCRRACGGADLAPSPRPSSMVKLFAGSGPQSFVSGT